MTEALQWVIAQLEQLDPDMQDLFAAYIQQKLLSVVPPRVQREKLLLKVPYSRDHGKHGMVSLYETTIHTPELQIQRSAIKWLRRENQDAPLVVGYDGRIDLVLILDNDEMVRLDYLSFEEGRALADILEGRV